MYKKGNFSGKFVVMFSVNFLGPKRVQIFFSAMEFLVRTPRRAIQIFFSSKVDNIKKMLA